MNPAGHTPIWASRCKENLYRACLPDPALFAQFVAAVARRYDGTYVDETDGQVLPRVGDLVDLERAQHQQLAQPADRSGPASASGAPRPSSTARSSTPGTTR